MVATPRACIRLVLRHFVQRWVKRCQFNKERRHSIARLDQAFKIFGPVELAFAQSGVAPFGFLDSERVRTVKHAQVKTHGCGNNLDEPLIAAGEQRAHGYAGREPALFFRVGMGEHLGEQVVPGKVQTGHVLDVD